MIEIDQIFSAIKSGMDSIYGNYLVFFIILGFMLFSSYTDLKYLKIYNKSNLAFLIIRIILIFIPMYNLGFNVSHIVGGIVGAGFLLIPAMYLMYNMGGDIKLLFVLGTYLGGYNITLLLAISCVSMLIFSLIRKIITKKNVKDLDTPFAPFFTFSFLIMYIIYLFI